MKMDERKEEKIKLTNSPLESLGAILILKVCKDMSTPDAIMSSLLIACAASIMSSHSLTGEHMNELITRSEEFLEEVVATLIEKRRQQGC